MNQNKLLIVILLGLPIAFPRILLAEDAPATPAPQASPTALPGKGLAEHDFMYAGEAKERRVWIVKKGKVVWSYDNPEGKGEISDATLLSNGNLLIAHQFAVELISPDKKVLWKYDAPQGTETHTAMPIGNDHVLFIQNGDPAKVKVVNVVSGETKKEFSIPAGNPKSVHGQFRHARITAEGTLIVAHMDSGKIAEYNADGKELWSYAIKSPWGVTPLKNGNFLIAHAGGVSEINRKSETVWECTKADVADYKMNSLQLAWRLPNGNTIFNTWFNSWSGKLDRSNPPIQAVEVTPDKKVVWALRSWAEPADLGPATTIQILDEPSAPEKVSFGDFK